MSLVRQFDTHRLLSAKHGETVLGRIADDDRHLQDIFDLDYATNDRLLAEHGLLPGIGLQELVFGVPYCRIVNAAFCHAHPLGSRFNGPDRGAWYASFDLGTSRAELMYHKSLELAEVGWPQEELEFDDYLADFSAEFHDLRGDDRFDACLSPHTYRSSQALAERLLDAGSLGVVYSSVRHKGGTCLACFRPPLVMNVRKGRRYRLRWQGPAKVIITTVAAAPGHRRKDS